MTIKINFLPREYAPPRKAGGLEWALAGMAAVAMVTAGVYYTGLAAEADRLREEATRQEAQLHRVKAQLAEATLLTGRESRVAQAEAELKGLVGRHWSTVLLTLRDLTPQHVTWQSLTIEGDDMVLKATSRGLIDVAQLFAGLITHQQVAEVALRYVDEKGIRVEVKAVQGEQPQPVQEVRPAGTMPQMEFELRITLVRQEGGVPRGA